MTVKPTSTLTTQRRHVSKLIHLKTLFGVLLLLSSLGNATASDTEWAKVFRADQRLPDLHVTATYIDSLSQAHCLSYWRKGEQFLRRNTDGKVELFLTRNQDNTVVDVVDHVHQRVTTSTLGQLLRTGLFLDWNDLARLVAPPHYSHKIESSARADLELNRLSCHWYIVSDLSKIHPNLEICWSEKLGIPLRTQTQRSDGGYDVGWQVEQIDLQDLSSQIFTPSYPDYAHIDDSAADAD